MEGVGARLGRSSTRYGPATVFSGPVRKWKKRWVHVANPNSNTAAAVAAAANGNGTGNNNSHLLLYKWTPLSSSSQGNAAGAAAATGAGAGKGSASAASEAPVEEPPRRKFRYVPVSVIEEQKLEDATKADDEAKAKDGDPSSQPTQSGGSDDKPDVNDVPMEEAQVKRKKWTITMSPKR
ncbi:hypothetical protein Taro_016752 [Colocasia esculenta]|uniref:Uncharacterized protein n=1 Tax=Colocasia esculenta TaxID=4460 RepID=A0A843ULN4_COLES|nr:hypothetical protein [Colocasia esculenta]